ncbi:flagellar basal body rod protein FlgB [Amphritea sp. 2_MG-2023]|uniref:flagellar basal body rod protein FlgB n=1 Tax=Amphritea TaxID=515417 RepID=UPI001C07EC46|nr:MULTISPECIES: flagellar basal body rod protein FlgB [Amphritea]MBU2964850.1 flagellar basal body rod protein FlgB [Amphritea atlantica]MDO6419575.1 flagellar basal body rod protein FlgB [Amphritea sp. 2_MG-2023]
MAISFDNALGIHEQAVGLRIQRAEILANNIANSDTPNYKARDIDFESVLKGVQEGQQPLQMSRTSENHNAGLINSDFASELMYRMPTQPSVDGNTVDIQAEMARYTENAIDYQASFQFLDNKFKGLTSAIKGE